MITTQIVTDIDLLMDWRMETLANVFGQMPPELFVRLAAANRAYYEQAIPAGDHIPLLAVLDGNPVGCGGLCFTREMPSPDNPSGICAYIMNIYVRRPFRNLGIAHRITRDLISHAQDLGAGKIWLEATPMAESLYRSLGFTPLAGIMKLNNTPQP